MKLDREYFQLTPEEIAEVEIYSTFDEREAFESFDERYWARFYRGKPISNAFYIHEREEIRVLGRLGFDPLAVGIHHLLNKNTPVYGQAHSRGIRAEFSYYKMIAREQGFDIPVPVLILFGPTPDPICRFDYLSWYNRLNHGRLATDLYKFSTKATSLRKLPQELVPEPLQQDARRFFRGLIRNEPGWKSVYLVA